MRGRGWDSLGERRGEKGTAKRKRRVLHQNKVTKDIAVRTGH